MWCGLSSLPEFQLQRQSGLYHWTLIQKKTWVQKPCQAEELTAQPLPSWEGIHFAQKISQLLMQTEDRLPAQYRVRDLLQAEERMKPRNSRLNDVLPQETQSEASQAERHLYYLQHPSKTKARKAFPQRRWEAARFTWHRHGSPWCQRRWRGQCSHIPRHDHGLAQVPKLSPCCCNLLSCCLSARERCCPLMRARLRQGLLSSSRGWEQRGWWTLREPRPPASTSALLSSFWQDKSDESIVPHWLLGSNSAIICCSSHCCSIYQCTS